MGLQMVEPLLSVKDLETRFGSKVVHQNLSLDVPAGQILVLLGGSGTGKSVLLRALIGLEKASSGTCMFEGRDLFSLSEADWTPMRQQIAYVFQGGALFDSLTVKDNLDYPLREHTRLSLAEREEKIEEILDRVGLPGSGKLMPSALSGGMQKRVGLARSLMLDPKLILYDEPTAGLDPANSRNIADIILSLKEAGKTGVLVTHDLDLARRVADVVAFIHKGKIAEYETMDTVRTSPPPLIDAYFKGEDVK